MNPVYDAAGNMTTVPQPADATKGFTAVYDAWNRLVSLTDSTSHNNVQQNAYDGRNYRVVRKDYTGGTLSATRNFYYNDGWQDVEERLGASPDSASPDQQYVWGVRYIDDVVCRNRSLSGTLDERLYGCQDANWNVTAIVDTSGAVQERYEYDPYGKTTFLSPAFTSLSTTSFEWDVTYCGYRFDRGSGIFAVRFRGYSAVIGRWLNRDPLLYSDGSSLYEYTATVSATDPIGMQKKKTVEQWKDELRILLKVRDANIGDAILAGGNFGCVGFCMGELGIPTTPGFPERPDVSRCFDSLDEAKRFLATAKCPGRNCRGEQRRPRIMNLRFHDTIFNEVLVTPSERTVFRKTPGTNYYDLNKPAYIIYEDRKVLPFGYDPYRAISLGGTGYQHRTSHFFNYDFALLLDNGMWIHGTTSGASPEYDTTEFLLNDFKEHNVEIARDQLQLSRSVPNYVFNKMFFCVLCEREYDDQFNIVPGGTTAVP